MGRKWVRSTGDRIYSSGTDLMGFDWRYGTAAIWINPTYPGGAATGCMLSTNNSTGVSMDWGLKGSSGTIQLFDGTSAKTCTVSTPVTGVTCLIGITKASGTAIWRHHIYTPSTGVFAHSNYSGSTADLAATTQVAIGTETNTGNNICGGEYFHVAMWSGWVMTDQEWNQLAIMSDWGRTSPGFYLPFKTGGPLDTVRTYGRYPVRITGRLGTTRGSLKDPMGGYAPGRRR